MKHLQMMLLTSWASICASAQGDPGWWVLSITNSHQVWGPGLTPVALFNDHANAVAADETGTIFEVGFQGAVSPFGLYRLDRVPTTMTWSFTPLSLFPNTNWGYIAVDRKRVWMLRTNGDLVWFDKTTPNQTPNFVVNVGTLGIGSPPNQFLALQCTNGRELFVTIGTDATTPDRVYAIDVGANPVRVRCVVQMPLRPWARPCSVRPGQDGKLLVNNSGPLYELDPATGASILLPIQMAGDAFDYDVWEDRLCAGVRDTWAYVYTNLLHNGPGWAMFAPLWTELLVAVTSMAPKPFEVMGIGCANGLGLEPRMGWQGLPRPGQSFALTLRDAEPGGLSFFVLGFSDTHWLGRSLPYDAAPLGAPGCLLRVSADVSFPVPVAGNGSASLMQAVPASPVLRGLELFAQTASSSTANGFGFAASDALVIRIR